MTILSSPPITADIFERLEADDVCFSDIVRSHFRYFCNTHGIDITCGESQIFLAWKAYKKDKKRLHDSLSRDSSRPDHYKLAGALVYWLRRSTIIYEIRYLNGVDVPTDDALIVIRYINELPAFQRGLALCNFFERSKSDRRQPFTVPDIPFDYFDAICYLMRFKNISPHAMGMIYRSLYIR